MSLNQVVGFAPINGSANNQSSVDKYSSGTTALYFTAMDMLNNTASTQLRQQCPQLQTTTEILYNRGLTIMKPESYGPGLRDTMFKESETLKFNPRTGFLE